MPRVLREYRRKRHFDRTAEPAGRARSRRRSGWQFVVQKHAARRLHYDFRLEYDGVLKSWAVPQGPCLDPSQKRLAVQVEDHPVEYGRFEGTIPQGEYGGGTVLLWDRGTWSSGDDVRRGLESGKLKFRLEGEKLKGGWVLARMRPRPGEKKENWLLIKSRDEQARPLAEGDILDDEPASVVSGRTIGEVAEEPDNTWSSESNGAPKKKKTKAKHKSRVRVKPDGEAIPGARKSAFPRTIEPPLATLVEEAPRGDDWLHEIKFDGYRVLAYLDEGDVVLRTRKQNDWTGRFPEIAEAVAALPVRQAVLDGEVVAQTAAGISNFQSLQVALGERRTSDLIYYIFDSPYLEGFDLREAPLIERKRRLAELLSRAKGGRIRYSEHFEGSGADVFAKSCEMKLEGIVSKRRDGGYIGAAGRSG